MLSQYTARLLAPARLGALTKDGEVGYPTLEVDVPELDAQLKHLHNAPGYVRVSSMVTSKSNCSVWMLCKCLMPLDEADLAAHSEAGPDIPAVWMSEIPAVWMRLSEPLAMHGRLR